MSRFTEMTQRNQKIVISPEIDFFLEQKGFHRDTPASVYHHKKTGYTNGYYSKSGSYYTRIHFTKNTVCMYKEYDCGGHIDSFQRPIEPKYTESLEDFMQYIEDLYSKINFE